MITPWVYFAVRVRSMFYRRKVGFMFFGLGLVIAAGILLWPTGQHTQAAGPLHIVPTDRRASLNAPKPAVEIVESAPSPTPTYPPLLTPTPLPIPDSGLVWGRNASGVYLWASPKGKIRAHLPNGTKVRLLDERSSYGNLPWIKVYAASGEGWILQTQVFREVESPAAYIDVREGTYLRDQPRGGIQQTLSVGTPIMSILETQETEGRTWALVEVVDGAVGWVVEEWLSVELPVGDSHD
jgi:hypothetical protein